MSKFAPLALMACALLAGCEDSAGGGIGTESPLSYRIEIMDSWPGRGDGFALLVQANGEASVQALVWDERARIAPDPPESIGRLSASDRRLLAELADLQLDALRQSMVPEYEPIYPKIDLRWSAPEHDPPIEQAVSGLYQIHLPTLPQLLFLASDRVRELVGEEVRDDWESSAALERTKWVQGQVVIGGSRFVYRGEDPVTLHFPSGCQMQRVLIDEQGTEYDEELICTLALTQLDFVRGQGREFRLDFDSGDPPSGWPRDEKGGLPPGRYVLRSELTPLAAEVAFEIVPAD